MKSVPSILEMIQPYANKKLPNNVTIVESGARDGLQSLKVNIPTETKIELIEKLADTGLPIVEVTAFVSPKAVPQMADGPEIFKKLKKRPEVEYAAPVPTLKYYDVALESGCTLMGVFTGATEGFTKANINTTIQKSMAHFAKIVERANKDNIKVRGAISCVMGCPYETDVDVQLIRQLSKDFIDMGCFEVGLADTIGTGTPEMTSELIEEVSKDVPVEKLAVHFHDTYKRALPNILAALEYGVNVIDSSVGGLGGCPFAPGATGNVSSEDVVYMLKELGVQTNVDLDALSEVGNWICDKIDKPNMSLYNVKN